MKPSPDGYPRLLLLDEDRVQTLYVADALAALGCDVHILTSARSERAPFHVRRLTQSFAPPVRSPEYLSVVAGVLARGAFDRVLPLTEGAFGRVWDANPPWLDLVFPRTEPWQQELLRNKRCLAEFAASHGVRVPRIADVARDDDVPRGVREVGLPAVVKGVIGDGGGTEVRFADSEGAALAAVHELTAQTGKRPFLQQFVSGPSFFAGGLFLNGRAIRLHVCEMVETFPTRTGPSVRQRTTHDVAALVGQFLSLMGALRWTGLAQGDFIRAPDGSFLFLEINPRPWGSISAARHAGVELFAPLAEILRGAAPTPDLRYRDGVDTVLFPQRLISQLSGGGYRVGAYVRAATDLRLWRAVPWKRPRLIWQLTRWMAYRFRDRRARERVAQSAPTAA